jgi:hypothetical protein
VDLGASQTREQLTTQLVNKATRLYRIRLHRLWVVLHLAIALYGLCLFVVCVVVA